MVLVVRKRLAAYTTVGFTIIELLMTVVLIAVLIGIAAPSLRDMIRNARMTGLVNNVMTDLAVARGEAVKRGARTTMCPSTRAAECTAPPYTSCACTNTDWNLGYLILQDADGNGTVGMVGTPPVTEFIKYVPAIDGATEPQPATIIVSAPTITFLPSGVSTQGGAGTTTFNLCDSRSLAYGVSEPEARGRGRRLTLSGTGRALSARCTCNANDPPVCNP